MQKLGYGKNLYSTSGVVSRSSLLTTDAKVGDAYEYIYIGDDVFGKTIIPHPLQLYLMDNKAQEYFFTEFNKTYLLAAIKTSSGIKYASPLGHIGKYYAVAKTLPVCLMVLALTTCMPSGRGAGGAYLTIFVLAALMFWGGTWAFGTTNRAFKRNDRNVEALRQST